MPVVEVWFDKTQPHLPVKRVNFPGPDSFNQRLVDSTLVSYLIIGRSEVLVQQVVPGQARFSGVLSSPDTKFYVTGPTEKLVVGYFPDID